MKKLFLLIIFNSAFLILNSFCFAQNKDIDSLLTLINKDKVDTNKVKHLYILSWQYINIGHYDTALLYSNEAIKLAEKFNFKKGISPSYGNIGIIYCDQGDYHKALEYCLKALRIDEELKNNKGIARNLGIMGIVFKNQGDYPKALECFLRALKMSEELGNKNGIAQQVGNVGVVYKYIGDYPKALVYYLKALKMAEEQGDKNSIARHLDNIGNVYHDQGNYSKALDSYFKALRISEEQEFKATQANALGNIGTVFNDQKDYPQALNYYFKSLKMAEQLKDKNSVISNVCNIGSIYLITGKFKEAEVYFKKSEAICDSIGALDYLRQTEELLSQLYDTTKQHKLALIYYKKSMALKDTIFSQENKKQLVRKEMNYEFDKKEAITKAENEKQQAIAEEKNRKQKIVIWSVGSGLFLMVLFAGFVFRSLRITRKQKNIIEVQKNEVSKQKDIADSQRIISEALREVSEKQKHIVEEKQKEILDSITYARRIQRALLTSDEYIKNNLAAEYFILFKPKDIVSGDFYWALRTPPPLGETGRGLFYMATADCTGHGVPGAFMSMLNISYLTENVIERGISMPHDILNAQRKEIIKALNPPGSIEVSKDGMDCILCVYDFDKMRLYFAAANNPLWLVRNGELTEYKADKMPVGKYTEEGRSFTMQTIELQKNDLIYTSTDGFADQFGANSKKLMKKTFKEELLKIHQLPMGDQKVYLNHFFENWKGKSEQVDDVTVLGVRI